MPPVPPVSPGPSEHAVDRLIRALIATRRASTVEELQQILERMATAPFDDREVRVPRKHRGISYQDILLGARVNTLHYHLVQRVAIDRQWALGTTRAEYLTAIERGVRSPLADLAVYACRGGNVAVVVVDTEAVLSSAELGGQPEPHLLVVYSADRGIILTAYQFSEFSRTGIPEHPLWLKRRA